MQAHAVETQGRLLKGAATFFVFAVLFHNADHVRRGGESVTTDVFWLGSLAILLEVGVVALVFGRHQDAPLAAALIGFSLALGYVFVHFTPERAWLNDTFLSGEPALISRVAGSLEIVSALALAFAGMAARKGAAVRGVEGGTGGRLSIVETFTHPIVAIMAVGNLAIFVLAAVDRYA